MSVYIDKLNQVHCTARCKIIEIKIVLWGPDSKFTQSTGCSFSNKYFHVTQTWSLLRVVLRLLHIACKSCAFMFSFSGMGCTMAIKMREWVKKMVKF